MAQELTPAQLERIKQQRAQRFKDMGLPSTAGQIMDVPVENVPAQIVYEAPHPTVDIQESVVHSQYETQQVQNMEIPSDTNMSQQILNQLAEERNLRQSAMYTAPRDKFNALEAIRRGAKKQEFNTFIKVESRGANGNQLPEPKVEKRRQNGPGQPQTISSNAVAPQSFNASKNSELEMLEGLFTDKTQGINISSSKGMPQGNLIETDENYSNLGLPNFDPVAHLRTKAAEKGIDVNFPQKKQMLSEGQVFNTGNNEQMAQMMLMMETLMKGQQKGVGYDLSTLKEMMEAVAKKTAEDMIRKVLKEYLETQKKKNIFEVVNPKQNVVKIEGKYYQLKPVTLKT